MLLWLRHWRVLRTCARLERRGLLHRTGVNATTGEPIYRITPLGRLALQRADARGRHAG